MGNGATFHFLALNDPQFLFDHIIWAGYYVDLLSSYLSINLPLTLSTAGVGTTNVAFTFLAYPRGIMGTANDRIEHI
jgi:hypothetical protein